MPFDRASLLGLRSAVAAHGSRAGLVGHRVDELVLVAHELAANAVLHGGGAGRLRLWVADGVLWLAVIDSGPGGVRPEAASTAVSAFDAAAPPPASASGGRGVWLARQLTDSFRARSDDAGTTVTVGVLLALPSASARREAGSMPAQPSGQHAGTPPP